MNATLNVAIAAEFELSEKIAEALAQSALEIDQLSIVEIYPFSEEQAIRFNNKSVAQYKPEEMVWSEWHYLFFAGDIQQVPHIANAAEAGCIIIDMKGVCSALNDVPVVVPGVNDAQLIELRQRNIVSLPDPQVTQLALAIQAFLENNSLGSVMVSSLLPASYVSGETVGQLAGQTAQLLNGIPLDDDQQRLAFDVFPLSINPLQNQIQKIYPQLDQVVFHHIQVPVFYGLGQMVSLISDYELDAQAALTAWQSHDQITYHAEKMMTPVTNGETESHEERVQLHLSGLRTIDNGVQFWSVADEQRFNLALMSVKLAELVYQQGY
ncbi:oxidoreductase [Pasteurella sp. PK-2025]|uniref:oxidoreductase n=1 Tax=unclassified Pasteurella TaxID=2621516 RepID=UPI003C754006